MLAVLIMAWATNQRTDAVWGILFLKLGLTQKDPLETTQYWSVTHATSLTSLILEQTNVDHSIILKNCFNRLTCLWFSL